MNDITIMGRLTKDPELTTTQSGVEMTKYCVAVDEQKGKNGDKKTNFFNCVVFHQGAAFVAKYFKKGDGIIVRGRMDSNKGNDGKTYWTLIADRHEFPLGRTTAQAGRGVPESGDPTEIEPPEDLPF